MAVLAVTTPVQSVLLGEMRSRRPARSQASITTWSSSARGAGPSASSRHWNRRSRSSERTCQRLSAGTGRCTHKKPCGRMEMVAVWACSDLMGKCSRPMWAGRCGRRSRPRFDDRVGLLGLVGRAVGARPRGLRVRRHRPLGLRGQRLAAAGSMVEPDQVRVVAAEAAVACVRERGGRVFVWPLTLDAPTGGADVFALLHGVGKAASMVLRCSPR